MKKSLIVISAAVCIAAACGAYAVLSSTDDKIEMSAKPIQIQAKTDAVQNKDAELYEASINENNSETTVDTDNNDQHFAFSIDGDKQIVDGDSIEVQDADYSAVLTEEGGRIYYISNDLEIKKDITEDFFYGTATFTAPDNMGNKIIVKITGNLEEYSIAYTEG